MTINDINVESNFRLTALRDDYIHAFVIYFVAEFTACPQRTVINTGKKIYRKRDEFIMIIFFSTWCRLYTLETDCFLFSGLCYNKTR